LSGVVIEVGDKDNAVKKCVPFFCSNPSAPATKDPGGGRSLPGRWAGEGQQSAEVQDPSGSGVCPVPAVSPAPTWHTGAVG
jgi:hypothetical protein